MSETVSATAVYAPAAPLILPAPQPFYGSEEIVSDYLRILKWSLIPILCFTVIWLFEIFVLQDRARFVRNPAEMACRVFGFSHYLVGLMFMISSRRMRTVKGWAWFGGLLSLGLLISIVFFNFGGRFNPVLLIFYFLFFMVHGFRDVVFFYKPSTDDKSVERTRSLILGLIQTCLIVSLMYVLVPAYLLYRSPTPKTYWPELESQIAALMPYLKAILLIGWLLLPVSLIAMARLVRKFPGHLKGFREDNDPILRVLLYSFLIILASPLLGAWIYNFLILSHFVGWYFYASRKLAMIPRQATPKDGIWKWSRGSVAGFQRLHLVAAAVFFVIILMNYFFLQESGVTETLFSANAFYYWTVIHVTISFAPRA